MEATSKIEATETFQWAKLGDKIRCADGWEGTVVKMSGTWRKLTVQAADGTQRAVWHVYPRRPSLKPDHWSYQGEVATLLAIAGG